MPVLQRARRSTLFETVFLLVVAAGLAVTLQAFAVKPYKIPSGSMEPTLHVSDRVLVNRFATRILGHDPKVGDVVVFHPPSGAEEDNTCGSGPPPDGQVCDAPTADKADVNFIKRVVAGPGDRISIRDGHVVLNGKLQKEDFAEPCGGGDACNYPRTVTVPADHYFMMGDNRGSSDDSRFWGPVPRDWIIGGAFATYWPPKRVGLL
jgi:signal peptidase I